MDTSRIIRTQITSSDLTPPEELVKSVNDGQTPLLEIVKALGEYLTSTEDEVRLKGLTFLSNLLRVTSSSRVNRQATRTLIAFYISKLDDFDSLPPTITALTVLSKLPTFDDSAAVEVYKGVVENVNMKSYVQSTRHLVYGLFDSLLALHRKALRDMGSEFINSYTKMVDGEKDPRNLLLLFSMARVILIEFDVETHIEDIFDITFCYFPITFKPPPNDPYGITADDLKIALRGCMAASPHFAKMALPLFLEKFATATGASMRDLMLTMAACFPTYGAVAVSERGTELWEGIKTEIMYSSDTSTEAAALSALESLMKTLYPTLADTPSGLAQDIIKEALEILQEPEKSLGMAVTKCLAALVRGSPSAGKFALSQALPQLFRQFNIPLLPTHRSPILSTITSLLLAAKSVYSDPSTSRQQIEEKSLESFRDALLDTLKEGLRKSGLRIPAVRGSVALIEIPGFLERGEVEDLVRSMNDVLLNDEDPEIRPVIITGLTTLSKVHPSIIESITLPLLFHNLPDAAPPISDLTSREKYRSILESLEELCIQPALFETLVIRITTKLDLLSSSSFSQTDEDDPREANVAYAFDLLSCLAGVIKEKLKGKHTDVIKYFDQLVPRLYGLVVVASQGGKFKDEPLFRDRRLLKLVGKITEVLIWELNAERQSKLFAGLYAGFEQGQLGSIVFEPSKNQITSTGSPLRAGASSSEQNLIAIYSSAIQSFKADATLPFASATSFLTSKIQWALTQAKDNFQIRYILDLISAFVNKRSSELEGDLDGILEGVWVSEVQDTTKSFESRQRGLQVYLHIVKALMLLRHPLSYTAVERVIEILPLSNLDPEFVQEAATGFGVLAEGKGKGKGKEKEVSHLTAKLLAAQKMWNYVLPRLISGDKEATGRARLIYLIAFSSLLPLVPPSLCLSDLPTILPLLLRSLSLPNPVQRTNVITTLTSILETENLSKDVDALLHTQAQTIVESLLKSASMSKDAEIVSSGAVRAAALRCLATFPDVIRFETVQSTKSEILLELGKALDDPLRAVRKEAVDCRAKWYRYGAAV